MAILFPFKTKKDLVSAAGIEDGRIFTQSYMKKNARGWIQSQLIPGEHLLAYSISREGGCNCDSMIHCSYVLARN